MRRNLFEVLRDEIQCDYISDLRYVDYRLVRLNLEQHNCNEFELSELLDAIYWFGNVKIETESKKEAYDYLLNLKR